MKSAIDEPQYLPADPSAAEPLINELLAPRQEPKDPLIIEPTPYHQETSNQEGQSNNCQTNTNDPRWQEHVLVRMTQPYMGVHNDRIWDKRGMVGRFMAPIEDLYFHFIPNDEMLKALNVDPNRVIT